MKKIILLWLVSLSLLLVGCGNKTSTTSSSVSSSSSSTTNIDLTQNVKTYSNVENIETIPLGQNIDKNFDCSKYGWNEELRMADKNCSGLPNLWNWNSENGYVVWESMSDKQTQTSNSYFSSSSSNSKGLVEIQNEAKISMNDTMSSTNTQNDNIFSKDITRNWFYHPDKVPVYGPWIHVNDTNANWKMWYGPYETNTDADSYFKGYKN